MQPSTFANTFTNAFPNVATPLGSTAYYVTRFSPSKTRDGLASIFLWKQELVNLYALTDPGVARMKLQWWQEQVFLPAETPSEHELARTLSHWIHQDAAAAEAVKMMILETDRHLHRQDYDNFQGFWQGALNIGSSVAILINLVASCKTQPLDATAGAFIIATEWLQLMGQHLRYNIRLIPRDLLHKHGLRFDELLYDNKKQETRKLLTELHHQVQQKTVIDNPGRSSSPLGKYSRLRHKLMQLLIAEEFDVLDQKISLTPIRKLWFAL